MATWIKNVRFKSYQCERMVTIFGAKLLYCSMKKCSVYGSHLVRSTWRVLGLHIAVVKLGNKNSCDPPCHEKMPHSNLFQGTYGVRVSEMDISHDAPLVYNIVQNYNIVWVWRKSTRVCTTHLALYPIANTLAESMAVPGQHHVRSTFTNPFHLILSHSTKKYLILNAAPLSWLNKECTRCRQTCNRCTTFVSQQVFWI